MKLFRVALVLALSSNLSAEQLPAEHFAQLPMIEQPSVSPDGRHVATILNGPDGPTIAVAPFGSRELNAIVGLKYDDHRIDWIRWANNERLLVSVSETDGVGSARWRVPRLYHVGLDGKGMKQIRRKPTRPVPDWVQSLPTNQILSMLPDEPGHNLMQLWDERDDAFAVFKVNIEKNRFKKLFANTYGVNVWVADSEGNIVYGWENNENTNEVTYWHRPAGSDDWSELHSRELYKSHSFWPASIVGNQAIVISDRELGREAAWEYDIETGEYGQLLFDVDDHDLGGVILSNDRSAVLGFYYLDHYRVDHYIDPEAREIASFVSQSFPGYKTSIVSRSLDEKRMIVNAVKDNSPDKYFWLDLEQKAAGLWFSTYPHLEGKPIPTVMPFEFESRDGLELSGYLTYPLEFEGDKPPLVVLPHGGPASRDTQYFNYWVQFLANRGYAVLQVNFRGSAGFGTAFQQAGWGEWGQAMQRDVYDAIQWVADQDLVDMDRKCVVGASYGGYVALVAAYQKPDEFRCIASIAGISDLHELASLERLIRSRRLGIEQEIGDPSDPEQRERMRENSAIRHVEEIESPLLVIHGTEDTRVRIERTRTFSNAAEQAGLDIEYLELENGTHFIDEYHNRIAVFTALDEFLAEHL